MDQLNTKSFDFKLDPINSCIHNVWICSWQQLEGYHYGNLEKIDKYVLSRDSHGYGASCSDKSVAPRGCNNARWAGCKLKELFHRIWMFTVSNL
jgi:hypothetical protein